MASLWLRISYTTCLRTHLAVCFSVQSFEMKLLEPLYSLCMASCFPLQAHLSWDTVNIKSHCQRNFIKGAQLWSGSLLLETIYSVRNCRDIFTFFFFFFQWVNESESPISLLQTILLMCEVSLLMILHNISKRVRFKTEGWNNPLQLSAVGLSFWWLWKLDIFFGRHQTP